MEDNTSSFLLKKNEPPTIFNREMALGGLITGMFVSISPIGAAIAGAGAIIGGLLGKRRIEHENTHGKKVGAPTFWNKKTLIGALAGMFIGSTVGMALIPAIIGMETLATVATAEAAIATVGSAKAALAGFAFIGSTLAATGIGAFIGGKSGKQDMQDDYEMLAQQQAAQRSRADSKQQGVEQEPELRPAPIQNFTHRVQEQPGPKGYSR